MLTSSPRPTPPGGPAVETRLGRKVVIGTVIHDEGGVVRVEDFTGAQWTLRRDEQALVPAPPRHQRAYRAAYYRAALAALELQIRRAVDDTGPIGPAHSRAADPAVHDLYRLVETPLGPYWFRARRLPPQAAQQAWRRLDKERAAAEALLARYGCAVRPPAPGQLVPSPVDLDTWRELRGEGLLEPEELTLLAELEAFWSEHADADRAVVAEDGSWCARYRGRAAAVIGGGRTRGTPLI